MPQKKKNILEKIVKKNYNNELEEILEKKQFDENVKSTLLSILYKIEVAYKDFLAVKKDEQNKEEYISNFLDIIQNDCNKIKIVKISDKENQIPNNRTYIINKDKKEIIAYPIERKLLYAIAKIGKKDKIIKDEYFIINETLSNLINIGNNINMVEPLRDFNGYSWTNISQEIESIDHNLIYQNLRMIIGYKFLDRWVKNSEFIIDYFENFKDELESKYGKEKTKNIIETISKISILLNIKFDKEKYKELKQIKTNVEEKIEEIQDRERFIEEKTEQKIQITSKIKEIDTIINDKELLAEEYKIRNENLPLENKIFSMRILAKIMEEEKEEYLKEIDKINEILKPKNFIKYKSELEEKEKYLKILDVENKEEELDKLKIEFQEQFLSILEININKAETKQDIEKIIYDFRYYLLMPYDNTRTIEDVEKLNKKISKITELIIEKAIQLKVIEKISEDSETNYEILKNIFHVRIINLEDAYLKLIKEKDKYYVQIFDENIFEEKVEIQRPKELNIKPNKKILIMTY